MARQSRGRVLASLEGKLGVIRREVSKALQGLKREIARREAELAAVKEEYTRGMELLRGRPKARPAPTRRRAKRARRVNWKAVFASLPARFSLKRLTGHPVAGRRSKAQLYAILSRWKKEGALARDTAGGYRKVTAKPRPKPKPRPRRAKPAVAPKSAPRPAAPRPESAGT